MIFLKKENDLDDSIMKWIQQHREEELCCVKILKMSDRAIESESETSHKSQNDYSNNSHILLECDWHKNLSLIFKQHDQALEHDQNAKFHALKKLRKNVGYIGADENIRAQLKTDVIEDLEEQWYWAEQSDIIQSL